MPVRIPPVVRRFVVRPEAVTADRIEFDRREAHHLSHVLRLRPGTLVEAVDGTGRVFTVCLDSLGPTRAHGRVLREARESRESPCAITLAQGVLKGERMTWAIQKATELGVARIVPLLSERVVAHTLGSRRERWARVAREAVKQCGRSSAPVLDPPRPFEELLLEVPRVEAAWLCWEGGGESPGHVARGPGRARTVLIMVGPEGGFTDSEVERAVDSGVRLVGLGPRRLRGESAGLVAITLCQHLLGDLAPTDVGAGA